MVKKWRNSEGGCYRPWWYGMEFLFCKNGAAVYGGDVLPCENFIAHKTFHCTFLQSSTLKVSFKAIGGGPGSFLQVKLRWKFQSQGFQRFLRNEDILPYEENIAIWIFGPPYFPIVKFHEKWPLKPAIWSYKIKIICLGGLKLHKKVKSNSLSQI